MVSRNLKPARQEYYNHFADVFAQNILAEECTWRGGFGICIYTLVCC